MSEFHIEVSANAKSLLKNGDEFLEAAKRCAAQDEDGVIHIFGYGDTLLPAATVVNASFACEMYLKALLLHYNGIYPTGKNGHDLHELFLLLPDDVRYMIETFFSGEKETDRSIFEEVSERHSKDFVDARYYVTKDGWQELSPIRVFTFAFNTGQIANYLLKKNSDL